MLRKSLSSDVTDAMMVEGPPKSLSSSCSEAEYKHAWRRSSKCKCVDNPDVLRTGYIVSIAAIEQSVSATWSAPNNSVDDDGMQVRLMQRAASGSS